jgi:tRNA modification GTPase
MFSDSDTIVALATPPGRGGIGVVRISGPDAVAIARSLLDRDRPLDPRQATFARVVDGCTSRPTALEPPPASDVHDSRRPAIDQVVATWFAAPHSYTGQDVVEISGHGSPVLLQQIVELAMRAGARLAEPGEFTLRAYINGRIDLAQAEAVADLVNAATPLQARAAMDQLEGTLTGAIRRVDAKLFDLSARLEASLDFPEEGFHFVTRDEMVAELGRLEMELASLRKDGRAGRVLREGRTVVIAGPPNAGKSSLFNALVGASRAIVTDVPGTTRDMLTERVDVEGLAITLVDTAGLREARDAIEAEGVARARQAQEVSALTLIVIDGAVPPSPEAVDVVRALTGQRVIVASKADVGRAWSPLDLGVAADEAEVVAVSAVTGAGLAALREAIARTLTARDNWRDPPAITNVRHLALVDAAAAALARARSAIEAGTTEELVLIDVAAARQALEEITGRRSPDDLLRHIFATFCVGK